MKIWSLFFVLAPVEEVIGYSEKHHTIDNHTDCSPGCTGSDPRHERISTRFSATHTGTSKCGFHESGIGSGHIKPYKDNLPEICQDEEGFYRRSCESQDHVEQLKHYQECQDSSHYGAGRSFHETAEEDIEAEEQESIQ